MALKLFLNYQTILEKTFPLMGANAYNGEEVDAFLDVILEDYQKVEDNILLSKEEYINLLEIRQQLENDNRELKIELERYKVRFNNIKSSDNVTTDNIELVKRINVLEKYLWNNGFNPNSIQ